MISSVIADIQRQFIEKGIIKPEEFVGCTEEQIKELMLAQNVMRLPAVYQEFLSRMGQTSGSFLDPKHSFLYPYVLKFKEYAIEILKEEGAPMSLPEDAFVFYVHDQRYEFFFFHTSNDLDDPIYYYYSDGFQEYVPRTELSGYFIASAEYKEYLWQLANKSNPNVT